MSNRELGIYINDHLSGATSGVALARRGAGHAKGEDLKEMWRGIAEEIAEDRDTLTQIRDLVSAKPNAFKYAIAWAGEKAGRLKLNGHLINRSDLGQMLELELLSIGVTGKLALWRALERLDDPRLRTIDFPALADRAESQHQRLEEHRMNIVPAALGGRVDGPDTLVS